ncbi:MAG: response regulator transcription factor, partial [bacterium]|nr:response regulator transcription factor [bacterium]
MSRRVLMIEDEQEISRLVELHLRDLGCEVTLAHDGNSGLRQAVDGAHDLIILDLMLPGIEGLEICRR